MYYSNYPMYYPKDDRFIGGGFLGPFILGGITGGLISRPTYYIPTNTGPYQYPSKYYSYNNRPKW